MKTPSKFPSSAVILQLFCFLVHFQLHAQISIAQKDTVSSVTKEKLYYKVHPIYLDLSLETLPFFWYASNFSVGIYLNSKHALGISFLSGGISQGFGAKYYNLGCFGLQYCGSPFKGPSARNKYYYKLEAGKVTSFSYSDDTPINVTSSRMNTQDSKPYYGRVTLGMRVLVFNFYLAAGITGKLLYLTEYENGHIAETLFPNYHFTIGLGLTLPYRKVHIRQPNSL